MYSLDIKVISMLTHPAVFSSQWAPGHVENALSHQHTKLGQMATNSLGNPPEKMEYET